MLNYTLTSLRNKSSEVVFSGEPLEPLEVLFKTDGGRKRRKWSKICDIEPLSVLYRTLKGFQNLRNFLEVREERFS